MKYENFQKALAVKDVIAKEEMRIEKAKTYFSFSDKDIYEMDIRFKTKDGWYNVDNIKDLSDRKEINQWKKNHIKRLKSRLNRLKREFNAL